MTTLKRRFVIALLTLVCSGLFGSEYEDGRIRLVLDPQLGRFSLYYMTDPVQRKFEALFVDQDPRSSVLTLSYNGDTYRLGESDEFTIREGGSYQQPSLIFESPLLLITQEFTFIATAGSPAANGVKINFRIENKSKRRISAGIRFLLDTKLGEAGSAPFITDTRNIEEETLFEAGDAGDTFWVSGNDGEFALMGSISADVDRVPDLVHIANWKRLDEVPWTLVFVRGRKFNNPPYAIRDSAAAYYYEPVRINREESSSFYLLLASRDSQGFAAFRPSDGLSPRNLAVQAMQAAEAALARISTGGTTAAAGSTTAGSTTANTGAVVNEPVIPGESSVPGRAATGAASSGTVSGGATVAPAADENVPQSINQAILRSDYNALQDIVERIDRSLDTGYQLSDDEIASIERDLARIRSRYADL
jgi:hypothetical protein